MRIDSAVKRVRPCIRVNVMKALSLGMALSVMFLAVMAFATWSMYVSLSGIGADELRLQQLIGEVAHLNELLTVSVSMNAATGNTQWLSRYREAQEKLDASLAEIGSSLAREEYRRNYPADTKLAYSRLLEMESVAMGLAGVGRPAEAMRVLSGTQYATQKALYSKGLTNLTRAIRERMSLELESWRWTILGTVLLGLASVGLLSLAWCGAWLLVKRHLLHRRKAEEDLASEKERLSVTLRSIGDGVITTDTDGKVLLMNRAAEEATGWSREEAAGNDLKDVLVIRDGTGIATAHCIDSALSGLAETTLGNRCVLVAKDGLERMVEGCCTPIQDSSSNPIGAAVVFRDITERSRIEEEAVRNEKLESLGLLAGGIAHDFNNMLTGIMLSISMTKAELHPDSCACRRLDEGEKALLSAKSLAHQLLAFSKGGHPIKQIASVRDKLHDWISFSMHGSRVKPLLDIPDNLWLAEIDEGQIGQVINNLIINAGQAMLDGGTIFVSAENVIVGADRQIALAPGRYVGISVKDRGSGIPQEHIGKIFDPYFTTKPDGIGLGLATSYTILKRHEGLITVESRVGAGTTFSVYLPAASSPEIPAESPGDCLVSGSGHVLLMDDNEAIRDLAGALLEELGYQVSPAKNGLDAIELYRECLAYGRPFDVVILDLTVPGGMGGKDAIRQLRKLHAGVKAIVSSGYSNDPVMANYRDYGFQGVLVKPYGIAAVSSLLHRVMHKENGKMPTGLGQVETNASAEYLAQC